MDSWELVSTTAVSAFFASLAAVAVSMLISRREKHVAAKAAVFTALRRHLELLWKYSTVHKEVLVQALQNQLTANTTYYPEKPSMGILAIELMGVRGSLSRKLRRTLDVQIDKIMSLESGSSPEEDEAMIALVIHNLLEWGGKPSSQ